MATPKLWSAHWAKMRRTVGRTLPGPCIECGRPVLPGEPWDLGHRVARALGGGNEWGNVGASHRSCNRRDARVIRAKVRQLGGRRNAPPSRDW